MTLKSTQEVRDELCHEFTGEQLLYALGILRDILREMAVCPNDAPAPYGLCSGIDRRTEYEHPSYFDAYKFVRIASADWQEAVIVEVNDVPELAAYFVPWVDGYALWQGPNREARVRLIEHLIGHCEALLAQA